MKEKQQNPGCSPGFCSWSVIGKGECLPDILRQPVDHLFWGGSLWDWMPIDLLEFLTVAVFPDVIHRSRKRFRDRFFLTLSSLFFHLGPDYLHFGFFRLVFPRHFYSAAEDIVALFVSPAAEFANNLLDLFHMESPLPLLDW